MKKIVVITLVLGLFFGLGGFADAKDKERAIRIALRASYLFPTNDDIEDTSNYGVEIQYNFSPQFAVALSSDVIETSLEDSTKDVRGPVDFHNLNLSFIASIVKKAEEKGSYFYCGAGPTLFLWDIDTSKGDFESDVYGFHLLAGYELENNIFGEIRYTQASEDFTLLEGRLEYSTDIGGILILLGYRY